MATTTECLIAKCGQCEGTGLVCDNCAAPEHQCGCRVGLVKCNTGVGLEGVNHGVTCNGTGERCERHHKPRLESRMAMTCADGTTGVFA